MSNNRLISGSSSGIIDVARAWNIGAVQSTNSIPVDVNDDINHLGNVSIGQTAVGETLDVVGTFNVTNTFASTRVASIGASIPLLGLPAGTEGSGILSSKGDKTNALAVGDFTPMGGSFADSQTIFLAQDLVNSDIVLGLAHTNTDPSFSMFVSKGATAEASLLSMSKTNYISRVTNAASENLEIDISATSIDIDTSAVGAGVGANVNFNLGTAGNVIFAVKPSVDNTVTDLVGRNAATGNLEIVEAASINLGIADDEIVVGTGTGVEGDSNFTWDGSTFSVTGDTVLTGKLTVTGLIDPIGIIFDESNSTAVGSPGLNKGAIYINDGSDSLADNRLVYKDAADALKLLSYVGEDALNSDLTNNTAGPIAHNANSQNWGITSIADYAITASTLDMQASAGSGGRITVNSSQVNLEIKTSGEYIDLAGGAIELHADLIQIRQNTGATTPGLQLFDNDNLQAITIQANDTTTSHTIKLPADNAVGELTNDGAGNLTWTEATATGIRAEGEVYLTASAATDLVAANPSKVAGTTTLGGFDTDFDDDTGTNNRLRYTGAVTKVFRIIAAFSMTAAASNKVYEFSIYKNGVLQTGSEIQRKQGTSTDVGAACISTLVELAQNDYVELWVEGITDTTNPTITFLNMSAE